jgi:hypothetical protein
MRNRLPDWADFDESRLWDSVAQNLPSRVMMPCPAVPKMVPDNSEVVGKELPSRVTEIQKICVPSAVTVTEKSVPDLR